jgi:hypothetical protein
VEQSLQREPCNQAESSVVRRHYSRPRGDTVSEGREKAIRQAGRWSGRRRGAELRAARRAGRLPGPGRPGSWH